MKRALFAGSFDPPTLGHLDIIQRAAGLFDEVIVGIGKNTEKHPPLLPVETRLALLNKLLKENPNIRVELFSGLAVDFAKKRKVNVLVRGVRAFSDFEHEFSMALANRLLGEIETVFVITDARYAHISSSLIREIGRNGGSLKGFIPSAIEADIAQSLTAQ